VRCVGHGSYHTCSVGSMQQHMISTGVPLSAVLLFFVPDHTYGRYCFFRHELH
jgi:hypothetical protein